MSETQGGGSASVAAKVLAEGEDQVLDFLEKAGVPDFGFDAYLDLGGSAGMRWPWGAQVNEASDETTMVTVTQDEDGIYRVESGPADVFWDLMNPPDDEE